MNAIMSPAIRIAGSGGLIPAETLTAAGPVQPHREPGLGRLVIQNHRVAKRIGEGALAAGGGKAYKGVAAVSGNRCAGKVVVGGTSRVVESDHYLVGVIRVSRSERLRLNNVRRVLRAGDKVDVRRTVYQW